MAAIRPDRHRVKALRKQIPNPFVRFVVVMLLSPWLSPKGR
jgi:hypothetical protein